VWVPGRERQLSLLHCLLLPFFFLAPYWKRICPCWKRLEFGLMRRHLKYSPALVSFLVRREDLHNYGLLGVSCCAGGVKRDTDSGADRNREQGDRVYSSWYFHPLLLLAMPSACLPGNNNDLHRSRVEPPWSLVRFLPITKIKNFSPKHAKVKVGRKQSCWTNVHFPVVGAF